MKNQIEKFKKFIEIIDGELFPQKPAQAHIASSLFIPREKPGKVPATAYINLEAPIPLKHLFLFKLINGATYTLAMVYYLFFVLSSDPTTKRKSQHQFLKLRQMVKHGSIVLQEQFYIILKRSFLKSSPDIVLLVVAIHEVRHRVQKENAFKSNSSPYDTDLSLAYKQSYAKHKQFYALRQNLYEPRDDAEELDADFIAFTMAAYFRTESEDDTIISEEQLKLFIKKYKDIMLWKSPAWK